MYESAVLFALALFSSVTAVPAEEHVHHSKLMMHYHEICAKELNISQNELASFNMNPEEPKPEKQLCMIKCADEKAGILTSTGDIDMEKLLKSCLMIASIEDPSRKEKTLECIRNAGRITECQDMLKIFQCHRKE